MRVHSRWRDGGHIFDDLLDVCVCVRGGGGGGGGGSMSHGAGVQRHIFW